MVELKHTGRSALSTYDGTPFPKSSIAYKHRLLPDTLRTCEIRAKLHTTGLKVKANESPHILLL